LFQKSTDGGVTVLPAPVRIDRSGEFVDNPDRSDLLPNKAFRAPNNPSIAYSPVSGKLAVVYQNYLDGATSGANISLNTSTDGGLTWSHMRYLSVNGGGAPAPQDQYFPWIAATPSGTFHAIWLDNRLDPQNHRINTFQADSTDNLAHYSNTRISTVGWDPDRSFFTSGAFIGDYIGIAAADEVIYPVWVDGRASAIDRTGIGESDIFTNVEIR
jgi:hypothetical protein